MPDAHLAMQIMFVVWVVLVIRIVRRTIAEGSVGLPAALVLTMSFLYGGCFVYAVPGYTHLRNDGDLYLIGYDFTEWTVVQGAFAGLLAILGFAIGAGTLRRRRLEAAVMRTPARARERSILLLLGVVGLSGYTVHYFGLRFPLSDAIHEAARNVGLVAICLGGYLAWRDRRSITIWLALAALIPLYYLVLFGFVSYGFLFGIVLLAFSMAKMRRKSAKVGLSGALLAFTVIWLSLTAFVAWFSFREEIRSIIWSGASGSLLAIFSQAIAETQLFSLWNFEALDMINIRLNLPVFIGKMIEHHAINPDLRQYGASLIILLLVLVPRFLWPDKPARGGSEFMGDHTGIFLSDSSTFGTGTVFEFYINFGYIGVLVGFIVFGWLIRRIDRTAHFHLIQGNLFDFARLFVVGIVAIDPLLRPFFIMNGAVFAWLLMTALKLLFNGITRSGNGTRNSGANARHSQWLRT